MQNSYAMRSAAVGDKLRFASRQAWLAGLGAAVVTRDWAEKEAGRTFGKLVREGTAVESRALRFVGTRVQQSVTRGNRIIGHARATLRTAMKDYAGAVTKVRQSLSGIELPRVELLAMLRPAAPKHAAKTPRRKAAKRATAVKRARGVKRTKSSAKRAVKR